MKWVLFAPPSVSWLDQAERLLRACGARRGRRTREALSLVRIFLRAFLKDTMDARAVSAALSAWIAAVIYMIGMKNVERIHGASRTGRTSGSISRAR